MTKSKKILTKGFKYAFCFCPFCETPCVGRQQTRSELEKYQDKFPDQGSVSKFEQKANLIVVPCVCGNPPKWTLNHPINYKRANELQKELTELKYL